MTISTLITSRDLARTYRTALLRPPSVVIFGAVLVFLVVAELVVRSAQVALFGAMFVGLLAVLPWLQAISARKSLPKEPTTFTVTEDGLVIRNDISDSVVKWSAFSEVKEANQCVFLKRERLWFIIPYRAFVSPEERRSFVEDTSRRIKATDS